MEASVYYARQQQREQAVVGWMLFPRSLWALCRHLNESSYLWLCMYQLNENLGIKFPYSHFCALLVKLEMCDECDRFFVMLIARNLLHPLHWLHWCRHKSLPPIFWSQQSTASNEQKIEVSATLYKTHYLHHRGCWAFLGLFIYLFISVLQIIPKSWWVELDNPVLRKRQVSMRISWLSLI